MENLNGQTVRTEIPECNFDDIVTYITEKYELNKSVIEQVLGGETEFLRDRGIITNTPNGYMCNSSEF